MIVKDDIIRIYRDISSRISIKREMWPQYIIAAAKVLYRFTLFLLLLSIFRLILHIVFQISTAPPKVLYWGIATIWCLVFGLSKRGARIAAVLLGGIIFFLVYLASRQDADLLLIAYRSICGWCNLYAKSTVLTQIFLSMGLINFSFSYVISTRDKQFCEVPLGPVIQEQFPEHGQMFVFYACLILIGLYSCGMNFHIIALVCLCGAVLALLYTCLMAVLFTFSHRSKQKMVEYYLYCPAPAHRVKDRNAASGTAFNRILTASDYINACYKANGIIPQSVARNLWDRLSDCRQQPDTGGSPDSAGEDAANEEPDTAGAIDEITYTQLVTCAATAWQHILRGLPDEQQSELISLVLQASLRKKDALLKSCGAFLCALEGDAVPEFCRYDALPLCGLVSHLRGRETLSAGDMNRYWDGCRKCLQIIFQIDLFYPRTAEQLGYEAEGIIPRILFLILENTLLIELSSLPRKDFKADQDFFGQLSEMERSFRFETKNCLGFSEWGFRIVCSYRIDWFRSHQGMLSAYLTYQRLSGLI